MQKSFRELHPHNVTPHQEELSKRFEAARARRIAKRKQSKAGRKANRRKAR